MLGQRLRRWPNIKPALVKVELLVEIIVQPRVPPDKHTALEVDDGGEHVMIAIRVGYCSTRYTSLHAIRSLANRTLLAPLMKPQ